MNQFNLQNPESVTIQFNGQFTINRQALKNLLAEMLPANLPALPTPPAQPVEMKLPLPKEPKRLAYTMRETAEILGLSYSTVHRLIQRRLLKASLAVRRKIIPRAEIERFLKETL